MYRKITSFLTSVLILSALVTAPQANAESKLFIDENIGQSVSLGMCESETQFDCIQSIYVIHEDGTRSEAKFTLGERTTIKDSVGQILDNAPQTIDYEYEKHGGEIRKSYLEVMLHTQKYYFQNYGMTLPGLTIYFYNSKRLMSADELSPNDRFEFSIKTSWLIPLNVHLHASQALYKEKVIPGGHLYTMSGSKYRLAEITDPKKIHTFGFDPLAEVQADSVRDDLGFTIDHYSKLYGTAFSTKCAENGYTVESSNAGSSGQPRVTSENEIDFSIGSPHTFPNGELVVGFYQAYIKKGWIDCQWIGNTISKSSSFSVSVTDPNGNPEVATTSVVVEGDFIRINASGFHYSKPTIKVVSNAAVLAEPTPSASPTISTAVKPQVVAAKKSTITCIKGKVSKKVTAINPKCPTGYKKKS